jgi:hypothetical protein
MPGILLIRGSCFPRLPLKNLQFPAVFNKKPFRITRNGVFQPGFDFDA